MGRRGPAPQPTRVKLLKGETRPSRVNYAEPIPAATTPRMPSNMTAAARAEWRRIVRDSPEGLIRSVDAAVLRVHCENVARYEQAALLYAQSGPLLNTRAGLVKNPLHQVVRDWAEATCRTANLLCLNPPARASIRVEPEHTGDAVAVDIGLPPRLRAVGGG